MVLSAGLAAAEPWRSDVDAAIEDGREQLMIMVFTAEWCVWCHRLIDEAAADPDLRTALESVIPVVVDLDRHPHLAQRLGVQGVPATLLVNRRGEAVDRILGYRPPAELLSHVEQLIVSGDQQRGQPLDLWPDLALIGMSTAELTAGLGHGPTAERRARRRILGERVDLTADRLWVLLTHPQLRVRVDAAAVLAGLVGHPEDYDPFALPAERSAAADAWRGLEPAVP